MDNRKDSNTSCTSYTSSSDWSPLSPLGSKSNRITGQDVVDPELTFGPMPQTHEEAEKLFDQLTLSLHDLSNTKTEYQTEMSSRSSSYDTNMLDTPSQSPLEQGEIVNDKSKDQDRDIDIEAQIDACLSRLDQARKDIEYYTQRLEKRLKQRQKKDRKERLRQKAHRRRERRQRRQAQQIKSHLDGLSLDPALSNLRLVPNTILSPKSKPISISKSKITKHRPKKSKIHPDFHLKIMQMARPLHPLVSYSSGLTHPFFPKTLLSYNLLTSAQLDQLALHFHQVYPPTDESFRYPLPVKPWITTNGFVRDLGVDVEVKRRRFGRFIGLRGCESPTKDTDDSDTEESKTRDEDDIVMQVEKDWERRLHLHRRGSAIRRGLDKIVFM